MMIKKPIQEVIRRCFNCQYYTAHEKKAFGDCKILDSDPKVKSMFGKISKHRHSDCNEFKLK